MEVVLSTFIGKLLSSNNRKKEVDKGPLGIGWVGFLKCPLFHSTMGAFINVRTKKKVKMI